MKRRPLGLSHSIVALSVVIGGLALTIPTRAQTETVLYSFTGGADGWYPAASLVIDSKGNFYGTTSNTVFKLTASGVLTTLHTFTGGSDGGSSQSNSLIIDAQGNLYGTTEDGGNAGCYNSYGCGVVFKMSTFGEETVLYTFTGGADGANPWAGVKLDTAGNLYGTTENGGAYNYGTVFKLAPDGTETVLYSFAGGTDGAFPLAGVTLDTQGNVYGTTYLGGQGGDQGYGTVFEITPSGSEIQLFDFYSACSPEKGCPDGEVPKAGVVLDSVGNIYGTTVFGNGKGKRCGKGDNGCGVAFKLAPSHTMTKIWRFTGLHGDGSMPYAGLVFDAAGNLFGTTFEGGTSVIGGTVFEIPKKKGPRKVLYNFCPQSSKCPDGEGPRANVVLDANGNLYGTTLLGGAYGYGTVFKLTP